MNVLIVGKHILYTKQSFMILIIKWIVYQENNLKYVIGKETYIKTIARSKPDIGVLDLFLNL